MSVNGIGGGGSGSSYEAILRRAATRRTDAAKASQTRGAGSFGQTMDAKAAQGAEKGSLGQGVEQALGQVSEYEATADKMVIDLATGRDTNIHNTMVELEKADIALKYTVQLRNRALSAYEELMRIQV